MRRFSFRPALTLRGRTFNGLRGWAGKPLHPPLTDVPVGAYVLAAAFDVISFAGGDDRAWARDFYRAASFALIGGAVVSLLAALTGFVDWKRSTEKGTQARRTVNAHAWTMITVTVLVIVGIAVRTAAFWDDPATPALALVLSLAAAVLTFLGGTLGGTLAYDYGFNVETAGDHPVWHPSETDVFPGDAHGAPSTAEGASGGSTAG
ncbi:MAG: DUF2231 domain-containing protein [Acidimicrobiia bacterium]|nr:DUF2231 domain-containing protein [Acidimicrobiia bacterium]